MNCEKALIPILPKIESVRALLVIVLTLINTASVFGQYHTLYPHQKDSLWGFADSNGQIIIEPRFTRAGLLEGGKAIVLLRGYAQTFCINSEGSYVPIVHKEEQTFLQVPFQIHLDRYGRYVFRDSLIHSKDSSLIEFLLRNPVLYNVGGKGFETYRLDTVKKIRSKVRGIDANDRVLLAKKDNYWTYSFIEINSGVATKACQLKQTSLNRLYRNCVSTTEPHKMQYILREMGLLEEYYPNQYEIGWWDFSEIPTIEKHWWGQREVSSGVRWYIHDVYRNEKRPMRSCQSAGDFKNGLALIEVYKKFKGPRALLKEGQQFSYLINTKGDRVGKKYRLETKHFGNGLLAIEEEFKKKIEPNNYYTTVKRYKLKTVGGKEISQKHFRYVEEYHERLIECNDEDSNYFFAFDGTQWECVISFEKGRSGIEVSQVLGASFITKSYYKDKEYYVVFPDNEVLKSTYRMTPSRSFKCDSGTYLWNGHKVSSEGVYVNYLGKGLYYTGGEVFHEVEGPVCQIQGREIMRIDNFLLCFLDHHWKVYSMQGKLLNEFPEGNINVSPEYLGNGVFRNYVSGHYYYLNVKGKRFWE